MISLISTFLMTKTSLGPKAAAAVSWLATFALAALALYLAYSWAWDRGRDHERARWEAVAAKIEAADTKADATGTAKAGEVKKGIDDANQRAADAARNSDDPLRDGLNSLRQSGGGQGD